jgi:intraflagellar transport protein 172
LNTCISIAQIQHDLKVDWLELNETAKFLLFRDKKMKLHLYNVESRERNCILNFCSYVMWVPDSDVVVAQNRANLCIWYNIEAFEKVTMQPIKGDIQEVKKENGKTNVVINEGINMVNYELDSGLIEFGTAMDDGDLVRAVNYLESVQISDETETMWRTLAKVALDTKSFFIAERCYAALGDVAKARFLRETNKLAAENQKTGYGGKDFYVVRARICQLDKNFKSAEGIYLENHSINEAIEMYQAIYKWDEAIEVVCKF